MTNLAAKFAAFEEQSETNHTELMAALNTIAFALGAPPTVPTVTIADLNTTLGLINTNIALQLSRDATYHASMLSVLGQINTNTDTIITNNSLNAQRLIAAIYATFCECDITAPLLAPPIDITPTSLVDEAKCRRIQFYLSVFGNWLNKIANYGASGAAITGGTLATLLSIAAADAGIVAVGAEVGAVAGPPGIVIGAVVGLITVAIYTLGGSVLIDYANQFSDPTLRDNMVQAMYAATNADEGYTAFKSTLLAGMSTIPSEIIYTLWWSAWSNDIYSGTPIVDDSAFDGMACAPAFPPTTDCITLSSVSGITRSDSVSAQFIVWPTGGSNTLPSSVRPGGFDTITASDSIWYIGSLEGYYLKSSVSTRIYVNPNGANRTMDLIAGEYQLVPFSTAYVEAGAGSSFTLEVCKSV